MSDTHEYDEETAQLEAAALQTPAMVGRRQLVSELLDLQPGETVLSIGCGPGFEPAALADSDGVVHAIDRSDIMLARAARYCGDLSHVTYAQADARALPVASETFDAATAVQVYEYVEDIQTAVAELVRVLRPGGRAVVCDADFDSFVWHSADRERMERVIDAWHDHRPRPHLGTQLASYLRTAGLAIERIQPYSILNTQFDENTFVYYLSQFIERFVADHAAIGPDEATAWADDLQTAEEAGKTFFNYTLYLYVVRKPESGERD